MTRRRILLFALLAALVLVGVGAWVLWPPTPAITLENATRIRVGMPLAEVEEILGGPARDDRWGPATGQLEGGAIEWQEWRTLSFPDALCVA